MVYDFISILFAYFLHNIRILGLAHVMIISFKLSQLTFFVIYVREAAKIYIFF